MHGDLLLNRGESPPRQPEQTEDGRSQDADENDAAQHLAAVHCEEDDACDECGWSGDCEREDGGKGDRVPGLFEWIPASCFHVHSGFHLLAHGDGFSFNGTFTFSHFHAFKKSFPVLADTSD